MSDGCLFLCWCLDSRKRLFSAQVVHTFRSRPRHYRCCSSDCVALLMSCILARTGRGLVVVQEFSRHHGCPIVTSSKNDYGVTPWPRNVRGTVRRDIDRQREQMSTCCDGILTATYDISVRLSWMSKMSNSCFTHQNDDTSFKSEQRLGR